MKKALKSVLSALVIICAVVTVCHASESINLPTFDVTLNGVEIDSSTRQYPLIVYKDITYFPMTYFDCRFLGVSTEWDGDEGILDIFREGVSSVYRDYDVAGINSHQDTAQICTFRVYVNGLRIFNDNEEYPLLLYRDVTYFPLTWRFAVEEFGWDYSFDAEKGLVISNGSAHMQKLDLPDYGPAHTAATDGKYYYYSGNDRKIYRTPVSDTSKNELIHTIPDNSSYADNVYVEFESHGENVYFRYHIGGASTGTTYRYKINSDGSCVRSSEGNFRTSGIGYNGYIIDGDGFTVETYNSGHVGTTTVYVKADGKEEYTEIKLDGIRFGEYRDLSMKLDKDVENGEWLGSNKEGNIWFNAPIVLGKALYTTGWDENNEKNSSLYRIDIATGEIKLVAENVGIFHAYFGWDNQVSGMSEMAIFDREGVRYRYSSATGRIIAIDENVLPMTKACGDIELKVVSSDGERTVIYVYDSYGVGSISDAVFETYEDYDFVVKDNVLYGISHTAKDGVYFVALDSYYSLTKLSELPEYVFVNGEDIILCLNDPEHFAVRLKLK